MRHRKKGKILDRKKGPREAMLKNLASSILIYEKVKTTLAKAKAVKPQVEKLITAAKAGDLAARRKLIKGLPQPMAVKKSMEVLGARYKDRKGGYTRIVKTGRRQGDGAEMAQIELV
ncbi:MAG: 50S ribosomal protein L17 [Patescibacteria group bacterium]|nr:50S ribosomal protein L17 [Patescibacteria group bacterium]